MAKARMVPLLSVRQTRSILDRIDRSAGPQHCWRWTGAMNRQGYGVASIWTSGGNVSFAAHRLVYVVITGDQVPDGLELDHLCRNRWCVNWRHLEPVTHRENVLRGESPAARQARASHCVMGHPYDERNTYEYRNAETGKYFRRCRTCHRDNAREAYKRKAREQWAVAS